MSQVPVNQDDRADEISLRELLATLWRGKWIIIAFVIVFAGVGVAYALHKPNIYKASVLLAPAQDEGGVNGLSGQLGGLASLAGINLGGGSSNNTVIAKETLKSRAFLRDFIRRHDLSVPLMASKNWNMVTQEWSIDEEIYNPKTGEWQKNKDGLSLRPTNWDMVERFRELLTVRDNKDTGLVTVAIASESPVAAKQWLELLIKDINERMREQDVQDAEARIAYLEGKLRETNISGMQQVFYQLIESETRTVMLANAQREYVFKTVDPAVIPQEKSEPKRALIVILAVMLGGMLGVLGVFVKAFVQNSRQPNKA
jgi:uncharacterized protein involved in exopolysaccharide biosynthesis